MAPGLNRLSFLLLFLVPALLLQSTASAQAEAAKKPSARIISLAPSDTELLYSVGAGNLLTGICNQCDYPPSCKTLPIVGTFVNVNIERLARQAPNTILLVSGQEALSGLLEHNGFHTVLLDNSKLSGISQNLQIIGRLTGTGLRAGRLASAFDTALSNLKSTMVRSQNRPRVFYCVWPDPLLTVGQRSFLNEAITAAGGINIASDLKAPYPHYSVEKLLMSDPDIIFFPHEAQGQSFIGKPPWSELRAIKNRSFFFLPPPAQDNLARPTLRLTEGLHWLATRIHPQIAPQLNDWIKQTGLQLQAATVEREQR